MTPLKDTSTTLAVCVYINTTMGEYTQTFLETASNLLLRPHVCVDQVLLKSSARVYSNGEVREDTKISENSEIVQDNKRDNTRSKNMMAFCDSLVCKQKKR